MHTEVHMVTPELAERWLSKNKHNRPMSRQSVSQLARAIERGEWQLTHQGIAFDEDDTLIDGQHRLAAVVKAGVAVQMAVTRGVPREAFTVMDTGRKRTGSDALSLKGEANATHLAASLRGLHLYLSASEAKWAGWSSLVTNDQLVAILDEHPGIREMISRGTALNRAIKITVTAATVGYYVTSKERPDVDQERWYEQLLTGAGLEQGDPRLTLRNTLLGLAAGNRHRKREDSREHLVYYLKAWNAWVEGRPLKLLRRYSKEQMPKVSKKEQVLLEPISPTSL
ncbi:hypothetical protein [Streptomyces sp. NPDC048659]|uniref:hypothetical protein n=1 Tax=Streptomyces sp. NPDC048659 TaxID=3155489 RepID=UPI00341C54C8